MDILINKQLQIGSDVFFNGLGKK